MSVDFPVCSFGCMFHCVYKLVVESIGFFLRCSSWFVVEVDDLVCLFWCFLVV